MAVQSIQKDREGPDWPLGLITPTINTPLNIMSNVDSTLANDPANPTPGTTGANEFTERCQQIVFQAFKAGGHGLQNNAGNIYIMRKGAGGAGNRDDYGSMVACLTPGQTFVIASASLDRNVFS